MPRKRYMPEEIVAKLRQVEVLTSQGADGEQLPEVGLYHYKARAYSPRLGRFLQTDPILWAGGMNLYGYVENDPANAVDPWGLWCSQDEEIAVCPARKDYDAFVKLPF